MEGQKNTDTVIWIDHVKRIHRSGKHNERNASKGVSIYRVPESIKITKPAAYDPLVVFLGPYHHKKHQQPTAMDEYKLQAVDRTLESLGDNKIIEWLVSEVKGLEKQIRDCYEDSAIDWDGDTLAWIMTMDACFILEFLANGHDDRGINIKRREIILDILKLENQIPLFILKKILELQLKDSVAVLAKHLDVCVGDYFHGYPFSIQRNKNEIKENIGSARNLLDLSSKLTSSLLKYPDRVEASEISSAVDVKLTDSVEKLRRSSIASIQKLKRAGIKLRASSEGKFQIDHKFLGRCTLSVPQIIVDDYTEIFLRNLLAFEACQRPGMSGIERKISLSMHIIYNLIESKEDVELFERAGIIENNLGTEEEVAKMFKDLRVGITDKDDLFQGFWRNIEQHYNHHRLNVFISELKEDRCPKPWYFVSFMAAVLLIVLTLLQTLYTVQDYYKI